MLLASSRGLVRAVSSDMFGQMGLAQSTHLKYMLYNGWAIVVANIILFALLFQILV